MKEKPRKEIYITYIKNANDAFTYRHSTLIHVWQLHTYLVLHAAECFLRS